MGRNRHGPYATAVLLATCAAASIDYKHAVSLDQTNFDMKVLDSDEFWMVEFFAPWCGHCQALAPEWDAAAKKMKGRMFFGAVDCTAPGGETVCGRYSVSGYPTIKAFGKNKKSPKDYPGERKAAAILYYAEGGARKAPVAQAPLVDLVRYGSMYTWMRTPSFPRPKPHLLLFAKSRGVLALTPPDWFVSLTKTLLGDIGQNDPAKRSLVVGMVSNNKEGEKTQQRFGVAPRDVGSAPSRAKKTAHLPALALCVSYPSESCTLLRADKIGKKPDVNSARKWVEAGLKHASDTAESGALGDSWFSWPSFPGPSAAQLRPNSVNRKGSFKRLSTKSAEPFCFSPERMGKNKGQGARPMCVMLMLARGQTSLDTVSEQLLRELADKYKNDPLSFVYVADSPGVAELRAGLLGPAIAGSENDEQQHIAVLKTGRRLRVSVISMGVTAKVTPVSAFLDKVLGGEANFKRLEKLPPVTEEPLAEPVVQTGARTNSSAAGNKKKKRVEL